ncbi:hypothetical protein EXS54_00620 [Patescibacteria group bacterium]|nr:hypothetical protein [Patescibacteria group bacterium]
MGFLLIIYGIFLVFLAAVGIAAIGHAVKFGFPGDKTRAAMGLYVVIVFAILIVSLVLILGADFSETL